MKIYTYKNLTTNTTTTKNEIALKWMKEGFKTMLTEIYDTATGEYIYLK